MSSRFDVCQIVLTRAEKQQNTSSHLFQKANIIVLDLPALEIESPNSWKPIDKALESLNSFDWLLLSSVNGVEAFNKRLAIITHNTRHIPSNLKIACVGSKTALALRKLGYDADYIPPNFVADSLVEYFPASMVDTSILAIRVQNGGRTFLAQALREAGAHCVEVAGYQSICPRTFPKKTFDAFVSQKVSAIAFTSSKAVQHTCRLLEKMFGVLWRDQLQWIRIISIGPQTTITCYQWFGRVDAEANPHNMEGIVTASREFHPGISSRDYNDNIG